MSSSDVPDTVDKLDVVQDRKFIFNRRVNAKRGRSLDDTEVSVRRGTGDVDFKTTVDTWVSVATTPLPCDRILTDVTQLNLVAEIATLPTAVRTDSCWRLLGDGQVVRRTRKDLDTAGCPTGYAVLGL